MERAELTCRSMTSATTPATPTALSRHSSTPSPAFANRPGRPLPRSATLHTCQPAAVFTGTGLTPPTSAPASAPELGSPLPHLHRDWAICSGTCKRGGRRSATRDTTPSSRGTRAPRSALFCLHTRERTHAVRANSERASACAVGIARLCRRLVPSAPAAWSPAIVQRPLGLPAQWQSGVPRRACTAPRRFGHVCVRSCACHARARDSFLGWPGAPWPAAQVAIGYNFDQLLVAVHRAAAEVRRSVTRRYLPPGANEPAAAYIVRHAAAQAAGRRSAPQPRRAAPRQLDASALAPRHAAARFVRCICRRRPQRDCASSAW